MSQNSVVTIYYFGFAKKVKREYTTAEAACGYVFRISYFVFRISCFISEKYTQYAIRNTFLALHVINKVLDGEHPKFGHSEKYPT